MGLSPGIAQPRNDDFDAAAQALHFRCASCEKPTDVLTAFVRSVVEITHCDVVFTGVLPKHSIAEKEFYTAVFAPNRFGEAQGEMLCRAWRTMLVEPDLRPRSLSSAQDLQDEALMRLFPPALQRRWCYRIRQNEATIGVLLSGASSSTEVSDADDRSIERLSQEAVRLFNRTAFCAHCNDRGHPARLIGKSRSLLRVEELAARFGAANCPVMVTGETGTGKELVARMLHYFSPRRESPFVAINCGAFTSEQLLASELFGHVRGAFTDAHANKRGKFDMANGGTLFLDEVGCMSPAMQVSLLRVLRYGDMQRVGDDKTQVHSDVRIVAACNEDLEEMVRNGSFRRDVYSRLCVARINVPSLRERRDDIPILIQHFLNKISQSTSGPQKTVSPEAINCITRYEFPDNIAGLENCLYYGYLVSEAQITVADLPPEIGDQHKARPVRQYGLPICLDDPAPARLTLHQAIVGFEAEYIASTLDDASGNISKAARMLGLTRQGLQKKLHRLRTAAPDK